MRTRYLKNNDEVSTNEGYLVIKGFNGSIFYADNHIFIDDFKEEVEEDLRLTPEEIQHMSLDGVKISGRGFYDYD